MHMRTVLLTAAAAVCLTFGAAEAASLQDVVKTVEQGYRSLNDLQATFAQKSTIAGLNREQKGNGEVALKRQQGAPAMFRFDYKKPQPQTIVSNGKTVWLYQPEAKQVMVVKAEALLQGGGSPALSYLTGLGDLSRDFTASFPKEQKDAAGNYVVELVPKKPSAVLAKLTLTVSGKAVDTFAQEGKQDAPFPIVGSAIVDGGGNRTVMQFSNVRANRGIPSSRFTFKVPAGVQVINQ